jgi:hypothetical protein
VVAFDTHEHKGWYLLNIWCIQIGHTAVLIKYLPIISGHNLWETDPESIEDDILGVSMASNGAKLVSYCWIRGLVVATEESLTH